MVKDMAESAGEMWIAAESENILIPLPIPPRRDGRCLRRVYSRVWETIPSNRG